MIEINPKAKPKPVPPTPGQLDVDELWAHWMNGGKLDWAYKKPEIIKWFPLYDGPNERALLSKHQLGVFVGGYAIRKKP